MKKAYIPITFIVSIILLYLFPSQSWSRDFQRFIVMMENNTDLEALKRENVRVIHKSHLFNIVILEAPRNYEGRLRRSRGITRVEKDVRVSIPNRILRHRRGRSRNPSQPSQTIPWGILRIKANDAWNYGYNPSGVIEVAVIDTGVDYNHPDLTGTVVWGVRVFSGFIFSNPIFYRDINGHGTHVAGTIAAINNSFGVVGVAPSVEIYAIKAIDDSGSGWISDIIIGIEQALLGPDGILDSDNDGVVVGDPDDDAAEIISMSFGGTTYVKAFHDAIKYAHSLGVAFVAAAGNDSGSFPNYPAAYPEVISVGATDPSDEIAYFSNIGVELVAPGVGIVSTYPGGRYATLSGTSMAAPHVTGVIALIQTVHYMAYGNILPVGTETDMTNTTIRGILHITAEDLGDPGYDFYYGYGIIRADLSVIEAGN